MSDIRSDIVEEAPRVAEEAEREGLPLRLLGGVAIKLRAKDGLHPTLDREYADLDWITPKGTSADVRSDDARREEVGRTASGNQRCFAKGSVMTANTIHRASRSLRQGGERSYEQYERT